MESANERQYGNGCSDDNRATSYEGEEDKEFVEQKILGSSGYG